MTVRKGRFKREDFERLAAVLSGMKGRFIMSLNDTPVMRKCFEAFSIATVETTYTAGGPNNVKRARELLITGRSASVV